MRLYSAHVFNLGDKRFISLRNPPSECTDYEFPSRRTEIYREKSRHAVAARVRLASYGSAGSAGRSPKLWKQQPSASRLSTACGRLLLPARLGPTGDLLEPGLSLELVC